jgi:hypothetical protein
VEKQRESSINSQAQTQSPPTPSLSKAIGNWDQLAISKSQALPTTTEGIMGNSNPPSSHIAPSSDLELCFGSLGDQNLAL